MTERANAAVLSVMKDSDIRAEFDRLRTAMYELDHGKEIDAAEQRYLERMKAGTNRPTKKTKKKKKVAPTEG